MPSIESLFLFIVKFRAILLSWPNISWPKAVDAFAFDSFVARYRCCRVPNCENLRWKRKPNRVCTWETNRMILLNRFDRATRIDRIDWFFHRKSINFRHRKQTILYTRFFWMNTKICWIYIFSIKLVFNSIMEQFFSFGSATLNFAC